MDNKITVIKMADNQCIGIKSSGDRCTSKAVRNGTRCSMHLRCLENNGPNALALKELCYLQRKRRRELMERWETIIDPYRGNPNTIQRLRELYADYDHELNTLNLNFQHEQRLLNLQQQAEIARTGIDPDAQAIARREEARERREHEREELHRQLAEVHEQQQILNQIQRERNQQQVNVVDNRLATFVNDRQNVHTSVAVKMVKETILKILKISVPQEYRWNADECSLTAGDIILKCKLTPKAAWQMTAKYCQDEDIYDMGKGIYGKVLDGVWQFILNSDHKEDLFKILKQEMEDNIGMCAQGNLSRLCNILSGYSEDISLKESVSETLGRLMGKLMEIDSLQERLDKAFKIFSEVKLPVEEWEVWLDPLLENGGAVSYRVEHVKNDEGVVIALKSVAEHN